MNGAAPDPRDERDVAPEAGSNHHGPDDRAVGIGILHDARTSDAAISAASSGPEEEPAPDDALDSDQEQRLPTMSHDPATVGAVSAVLAQTRQDSGTAPLEQIVELLRGRLKQAGVDLDDADVEELARQVSTGDSSDPD